MNNQFALPPEQFAREVLYHLQIDIIPTPVIRISWERKGRVEGQADLLIRQLKKKFITVPAEIENRVRSLPPEKLQQLAEAIFDLETFEDVKAFL
jgi:hypothetical protein